MLTTAIGTLIGLKIAGLTEIGWWMIIWPAVAVISLQVLGKMIEKSNG